MDVDTSEPDATIDVRIDGIGNITVDQLTQIFGLAQTPYLQRACKITVHGEQNGKYAIVNVPVAISESITKLNGMDADGNKLNISIIVTEPPTEPPAVKVEAYVEIDTTDCKDCYEVAAIPTAVVVHTISTQLPKDASRRVQRLRGRNDGKYKIFTNDVEPYREIKFLTHNNQNLASVKVKTQEKHLENGRVIYKSDRQDRSREKPFELLVTLYQADLPHFGNVSDEEIITEIVSMGVGRIKKSVQPQPLERGSEEFSGNKFFVLKDLKPEDLARIPQFFVFQSATGPLKMWLNFKGKKRKCFFCAKFHDGPCALEQQIRKLEEERDRVKQENNNRLPIKTYSDSSLRLACQKAVASNVDCMSGASTGNILNAVEIDPDASPLLCIMAGQNELHRMVDNDEFLWSLSKNKERLANISQEKNVAILPPPVRNSNLALEKVKEEFFFDSLQDLCTENENIKLWPNPVKEYSDDDGRHPSREETEILLRYIQEKSLSDFNTNYFLPSASTETLTTEKLYGGVNSLYKYGCSGCNAKERNKWYNLCEQCKDDLKKDEKTKDLLEKFNERLEVIENENNPPLLNHLNLSSSDEYGMSCVECGVEFDTGTQIREHFDEKHPGTPVPDGKNLRAKHKYTNKDDDDNCSRRTHVFKPTR